LCFDPKLSAGLFIERRPATASPLKRKPCSIKPNQIDCRAYEHTLPSISLPLLREQQATLHNQQHQQRRLGRFCADAALLFSTLLDRPADERTSSNVLGVSRQTQLTATSTTKFFHLKQ
jgi:hypothetical protein